MVICNTHYGALMVLDYEECVCVVWYIMVILAVFY